MSGYNIKIKEMPDDERPRERLLKRGPSALSNAELLAVILRTGTKNENVVSICKRILSSYNLKQLSLADMSELIQIHGVGYAKAAQIIAVFELARNLETFIDNPKTKIQSPLDVYSLFYPKMREKKKKRCMPFILTQKIRY